MNPQKSILKNSTKKLYKRGEEIATLTPVRSALHPETNLFPTVSIFSKDKTVVFGKVEGRKGDIFVRIVNQANPYVSKKHFLIRISKSTRGRYTFILETCSTVNKTYIDNTALGPISRDGRKNDQILHTMALWQNCLIGVGIPHHYSSIHKSKIPYCPLYRFETTVALDLDNQMIDFSKRVHKKFSNEFQSIQYKFFQEQISDKRTRKGDKKNEKKRKRSVNNDETERERVKKKVKRDGNDELENLKTQEVHALDDEIDGESDSNFGFLSPNIKRSYQNQLKLQKRKEKQLEKKRRKEIEYNVFGYNSPVVLDATSPLPDKTVSIHESQNEIFDYDSNGLIGRNSNGHGSVRKRISTTTTTTKEEREKKKDEARKKKKDEQRVMIYKRIESDFKCEECKKIAYKPMIVSPCGHIFCASCLSKIKGGSVRSFGIRCPACVNLIDSQDSQEDNKNNIGVIRSVVPDEFGSVLIESLYSKYPNKQAFSDEERKEKDKIDIFKEENNVDINDLHFSFVNKEGGDVKCPECNVEGVDDSKCGESGIHEKCFSCENYVPIRENTEHRPQQCDICKNRFCSAYFSNFECESNLVQLKNREFFHIPQNSNVFYGFSDNELKDFLEYLHEKKISLNSIWKLMLGKVSSKEIKIFEYEKIDEDSYVCDNCASEMFSNLLFEYRLSIPTDELPKYAKNDCAFGRECKSRFNNPFHSLRNYHMCKCTRNINRVDDDMDEEEVKPKTIKPVVVKSENESQSF